jgi:hypothetical protein
VLRYRTQIISFGIASSGHASKTPSLHKADLARQPRPAIITLRD